MDTAPHHHDATGFLTRPMSRTATATPGLHAANTTQGAEQNVSRNPHPQSEDGIVVTLRFPADMWQRASDQHAHGHGHMHPHALTQYTMPVHEPPIHPQAHGPSLPAASPFPFFTNTPGQNLHYRYPIHFAEPPGDGNFSTPRRNLTQDLPLPFYPGANITQAPLPVHVNPESEGNNIVVSRYMGRAGDTVPLPQSSRNDPRTGAMQEPAQAQVQLESPSSNAAPAQPSIEHAEQSSGELLPAAKAGASPGSAPLAENERHVSEEPPTSVETPQTPSWEWQTADLMATGLYARERNPRRPATKLFREARAQSPKRKRDQTNAPASSKKANQQTSNKKVKRSSTAEQRQRTSSLRSASSNAPPAQPEEAPAVPPVPIRPKRDEAGDRKFVQDVLMALEPQTKRKIPDMGKRQASRISALLEKAEFPDASEAHFLATEEAMEAVSAGQFFEGVIVTTNQQTLPLQTVEEFLNEYYEDNAEVWIQDPAVRPGKNSPITRKVKMKAIKQRFAAKPNPQPWNLLELATHCDDGLRPLFLNTEDCRLLTKIKIPNASDQARRKTYEAGYKEVEKWALLAQAGALTEPHQDSHGYSTFITVNVGLVGFGWLSSPTEQERAEWRANPLDYLGGSWRYVVLKPGQTVYFPAGTVHFVFRLAAEGNTLAFGGHILRCSNIVHWVKTLIEERDQKNVTNEDLTDSATGYLERVERFVKQAIANGQAEKWGGEESIEEFLRLKEDFGKIKQR